MYFNWGWSVFFQVALGVKINQHSYTYKKYLIADANRLDEFAKYFSGEKPSNKLHTLRLCPLATIWHQLGIDFEVKLHLSTRGNRSQERDVAYRQNQWHRHFIWSFRKILLLLPCQSCGVPKRNCARVKIDKVFCKGEIERDRMTPKVNLFLQT